MGFRRPLAAALAAVAGWGVLAPGVAVAQEICAGLPSHAESPIVDRAGAVLDQVESLLARNITAQRDAIDAAIAVAVVPTTGGRPIEQYAGDLFECWGVGDAAADDGVLLVVAVKDRRVRIHTGTGLGTRFPDAEAKQVIDEMILPAFRAGDVTGGVAAGVAGIIAGVGIDVPPYVPGDAVPTPSIFVDPVGDVPGFREVADRMSGFWVFAGLFGVGIVVMIVRGLVRAATSVGSAAPYLTTGRHGFGSPVQHPDWDGRPWWSAAGMASSSSSSDSFSSGFSSSSSSSSSSFGGGSSSGGGASGSW